MFPEEAKHDISAVIVGAVVLPDSAQCPNCGFFDVDREDIREMLRQANKPIDQARCKRERYCIM